MSHDRFLRRRRHVLLAGAQRSAPADTNDTCFRSTTNRARRLGFESEQSVALELWRRLFANSLPNDTFIEKA
jgi:hypothetical protein